MLHLQRSWMPIGEDVRRTKPSAMNAAFRVSLICAALPLTAGLAIFATWLATRWDWLALAGVFTIYGGLASVSVGVLALGWGLWLARSRPDHDRQRPRLSAFTCGLLLLANFPVAAGLTYSAVQIESAYTVVIMNSSAAALRDVHVIGGGCDVSFGTIQPGDRVKRTFWVQFDGTLELVAEGTAGSYHETIEGYVTNGWGGKASITVNRDGTWVVSHDDT